MELRGARSNSNRLFKLRGYFAGRAATLLIDSGADSDFIDPDFANHCGLDLTPSRRSIKLADGSIVSATGQVTTECDLVPADDGTRIPFEATFTATPLDGYDAILGVTWLERHNVNIEWRDRRVTIRTAGQPPREVKPLDYLDIGSPTRTLATLSLKALKRAHRRQEIDEVFAIILRPDDASSTHSTTPKECPVAESLLREFADVFPDQLPPAHDTPKRGVEHRIELKPGSRPPPCRPLRHQSPKDLAVFDEYTRTELAAGRIRVSQSPYGSMALIVRKKDGTSRVVVDFRGLNEITVKNKYPLPLMDELFDRVFGARFFTKIDLRTGFFQILIHPDDAEKTAFRTRYGSFEYVVLPMGLCNAPGTFMQLMNDTFRDLLDKIVLVFLDDILIFSRTAEEHEKHVRIVLERLRASKLYAKRSKCEFFRDNVEFLGHRLGANGLSVSQDKIESVQQWPIPKNATDVRAFLGLAGFYRKFVKDFSKLALPMTELTKTENTFVWGAAQQQSFAALKTALCTAPVLLVADPTKPYTLSCDACDYAIGATLQQDQGHGLQPVAYMSRKLKPAEVNYDTREKEFLALHDACLHWRHYLHSGQPFTLQSDHASLKYHKTMPNLSGRLARWIEHMAEFDYEIEHIAGAKNVVPDALSRRADLKSLELVWLEERDAPMSLAAARSQRAPRPAAQVDNAAEARQRQLNRDAAEKVTPPAVDRPAPKSNGTIVMPSQRCTADTKRGEHCRQRTAKGQYCWNHLRSIRGLRIKKSPIAGAGLGLFADRDLPADYRVDYTGDRVPLASDRDGGSYFLQLSVGVAVDAARTNCGEGRWINDPRGTGLAANSEFVLYTPPGGTRTACVRTLRPVKKG